MMSLIGKFLRYPKPYKIHTKKHRPYKTELIRTKRSKLFCVSEIAYIKVVNGIIITFGIYHHYQKANYVAVVTEEIHKSFIDLTQFRDLKSIDHILKKYKC